MALLKFPEALELKIFEVIAQASEELNLESYVIGGYVRDFLLKRGEAKDIDIVAVGSGIELAKKVASLLPHKPKVQVFKTYGTAMLRDGDTEIEFVGARKESYSEDSRNPTVENGSLQDDQNRRDFTINALALSLDKESFGNLLDPFNGIGDLEREIIRTTSCIIRRAIVRIRIIILFIIGLIPLGSRLLFDNPILLLSNKKNPCEVSQPMYVRASVSN